jgi:3-oxoacyl-[acyl-carrier-protein] synthase-3
VVPHQANNRILESAARNLKLDESKFISTVEQFGNTSAASIPMALCVALEQGRIKDDDNIVFIGFGGGLTWAAMVIQWGAKLDQESRSGPIFIRFRRRIAYLLARWHARLKRILRRSSNWLAVLGFRVGNDKEIRLKTDRHDR